MHFEVARDRATKPSNVVQLEGWMDRGRYVKLATPSRKGRFGNNQQ